MSSNIRIHKVCEFCYNDFVAKTTVTKYCGDLCAKKAYKARKRAEKLNAVQKELKQQSVKPIASINAKAFLKVSEAAVLLACSSKTIYRLIDKGIIKGVNLGERMTRVSRESLNRVLIPENDMVKKEKEYALSDCYTLAQVKEKYGISDKTLSNFLVRNSIPKIKDGWYVYVPKELIDKQLNAL